MNPQLWARVYFISKDTICVQTIQKHFRNLL